MQDFMNYLESQAMLCEKNDSISKNLYAEYGVKRGLRDEKGQGVLTGLTNISDIKAFEYRDGQKCPCDGELSYRGYNIRDASKAVKNLEDKGYVTWKLDEKKEKTYIVLTNKAVELSRGQKRKMIDAYEKITANIRTEDMEITLLTLSKIRQLLEEIK